MSKAIAIQVLENDIEGIKVEPFLQNEILQKALVNDSKGIPLKQFTCDQLSKGKKLSKHIENHLVEIKVPKEKENKLFSKKNRKLESSLIEVSHEALANESKEFYSDQCSKASTQLQSSNKHIKNNSVKLKYECNVCPKKFISSDFLIKHSAVHSVTDSKQDYSNQNASTNDKAKRVLHCKVCNKSFICDYNLITHVKSHAKLVEMFASKDGGCKSKCEYKCDICNVGFNHADALYIHGYLEHEKQLNSKTEKIHSCKVCCAANDRNKNPYAVVHGFKKLEKKHECSVCNKKLGTKSSLKDHMLTHTGEKPWACEVCSSRFSHKSALSKHRRTHTGERPYECNVCFKKFATKSNLTEHLNIHTKEKHFACDVCQKIFWRKEALNEHYIVHTGEYRYKCDVCSKAFKYSFRLKLHYKIHKKSFECDICKKKFSTKHQCKEHTYLHTGAKPYLCTHTGCGKTFRRAATFSRHIMIHTGRQPFSCEICKKSFNQKTSLKRHYVVHTLEKPYSCEFCNQSFTQKSYFELHRRQKHDKITELEEIKSESLSLNS